MRLLLSRAHLLQERLERNEAVIVSGVAQLLHQVLGLLLGQLLTEVHQQLEQLELQDGVVGIFCRTASGSQRSRGSHPGPRSPCRPCTWGRHQAWVEVAGTDKVANIEGVNLAISLEVIDVKGKVDGINLLLLKSKLSHFVLGGLPLSSLTSIEGEDRTEVPMYSALPM